jgi:hypothetical protein
MRIAMQASEDRWQGFDNTQQRSRYLRAGQAKNSISMPSHMPSRFMDGTRGMQQSAIKFILCQSEHPIRGQPCGICYEWPAGW